MKEKNIFYTAVFFGIVAGVYGSGSIVLANENEEVTISQDICLETNDIQDNTVISPEQVVEDNLNGIVEDDVANNSKSNQSEGGDFGSEGSSLENRTDVKDDSNDQQQNTDSEEVDTYNPSESEVEQESKDKLDESDENNDKVEQVELEENILDKEDALIEDGTYEIESSVVTDLVLDIRDGSISDGAVVQTYQSNSSEAQKFLIERGSDGYYRIKNINSGKYLSTSDSYAMLNNGLIITQRDYANSLSQKWMIKIVNGKYVISSAMNSNLVLDITGGSAQSGTTVQLYSYNGTGAQLWTFRKTKPVQELIDDLAAANKDVIQDGNYVIGSVLNGNQLVSIQSNGNVILSSSTGFDEQGWTITHTEKGYIVIKNISTGKVLDIYNGSAYAGANVQQYTYNGSRAQLWIAIQDEKGIRLVSALNTNLVFDLTSGSIKSGTNIQMYTANGSQAQRWVFKAYELLRDRLDQLAAQNKDTIADGTYAIGSMVNNNVVIDIINGSSSNGANVQVTVDKASASQGWIITHDSKGYVTLKNLGSGKVLDITNGSKISGTNVQQYTSNDSYAQKWIIVATDTGYKIVSALDSNLVLDLFGGQAMSGSNIQIYTSNNSQAQRWQLTTYQSYREKMDALAQANREAIQDGTYFIQSEKSSYMVIDVTSGSTANGANVQLYADNGSKAQGWIITHDSKGYAIIKNANSNKVLDVASGNAYAGANVQQYTFNDSYAQKWIIMATNTGYKIVSALDANLVLDLYNGYTGNGTNLQLYTSNDSMAQRWDFSNYPSSIKEV